jgi:hypothetical protein
MSRNVEPYLHAPTPSWHSAELIEQRDYFAKSETSETLFTSTQRAAQALVQHQQRNLPMRNKGNLAREDAYESRQHAAPVIWNGLGQCTRLNASGTQYTYRAVIKQWTVELHEVWRRLSHR